LDLTNYQERLSQLVAIPSVSSTSKAHDQSNEGVIDLLANWCESLDFSIEKLPVPDTPGKYNLIATKGHGKGGLVLSGHSDTVPCNPEKWEQDPWQLTARDNRLYGLGATDMKGFFPVVLSAAELFSQDQLKAPIILVATADEESTMAGAKALVSANNIKAKAAIIGEPTGLRPINAHKGVMMESISIIGKAGHSSNPELGINAMSVAAKVITFLETLACELKSSWHDPRFEIDHPTLNLGCIHGGDSPNRICGEVTIHFDVRTLPDLQLEQLRTRIFDFCHELAQATGTIISFRPLIDPVPAFDSGLSDLVRACETLTESTAKSVAFGTEAPHFKRLGMDTLVIGPGAIEVAHQPNEYIPLDQIEPAERLITQLIKRYCC